MLKAILIRKGLQIAVTFAATTIVPFLVYDKPRIKWVWDHIGPRVVETAVDYVDDGKVDVKIPGILDLVVDR